MTELIYRVLDSNTQTLKCVLPGDVLSTNAEQLRAELDRALLQPGSGAEGGWRVLEMDLSHAAMVDSVGLGLMVSVLKAVQARGGSMRILVRNRNVLRTLRFTRLDRHLDLVALEPDGSPRR